MTLESIPAQARLLRFMLRSSGRWLCFQVGVAWTGLLLEEGGRASSCLHCSSGCGACPACVAHTVLT